MDNLFRNLFLERVIPVLPGGIPLPYPGVTFVFSGGVHPIRRVRSRESTPVLCMSTSSPSCRPDHGYSSLLPVNLRKSLSARLCRIRTEKAPAPVADLGGRSRRTPPPTDQIFLNFIGFFRKYTNILGRRP